MGRRSSLSAALLLSGALVACGAEAVPRPAPVLLIGVDGLDPVVVEELLSQGRLPNLRRFHDHGVIGRVSSMLPTYSPVIWTSIATGQGAERHGIDFFHEADTRRPYTSNTRRVPALWNLVSDADLRVDCVGWWITWPAETINGRMVASYAAQAQAELIWKPNVWSELEDQTWPASLQAEIEPLITFASEVDELKARMEQAFDVPAERSATADVLLGDLAWTHSADLSFTAITEQFLADETADLTMVYLALPDVAGHRFWRYYRPYEVAYEVEEPDRSALADVLRRATSRSTGSSAACSTRRRRTPT